MPSLAATIVFFLVGVALVIKGGDLFVSASVAIAYHARIPRVVIGSTLVSLATTAPEMAVSATASLRGSPGLAIGNAVGSAIVNIGFILGVLCVLHPMPVRARDFRVPVFAMLAAGILLFLLPQPVREAGRPLEYELKPWTGGLLLLCGAAYLFTDYWRHRPTTRQLAVPAEPEAATGGHPEPATGRAGAPPMRLRTSILLFLLGAAIVIGGSRLLTDNALELARAMRIPPMIVGLTLVALGTSLPELVTAITSARKGVPELSLGNVVGANIMNVTLVTGVAALLSVKPLVMSLATRFYTFPAMLGIFVLLIILARTGRRLTRAEGVVLMAFYAAYLVGLILMRE